MFIDEINEKILTTYESLVFEEDYLRISKIYYNYPVSDISAPSILKTKCKIKYLKLKIQLLKFYIWSN